MTFPAARRCIRQLHHPHVKAHGFHAVVLKCQIIRIAGTISWQWSDHWIGSAATNCHNMLMLGATLLLSSIQSIVRHAETCCDPFKC